MKILVIHGSPRPHGNTYRVVTHIEEAMKATDSEIEFEWVYLSRINLQPCKGCYRCLELGEAQCPIKDDREQLETKMHAADGVIFSSPVYVANVSALFKNFVDRFAYICHRPRFHHKKALVVTSTGSVAAGIVGIMLSKLKRLEKPKAPLKKLYAFKLQQVGFGSAAKDKADYQYWYDMGWLDSKARYYVPASINPIKLGVARILAQLEMKKYPKGNG